MTGSTLVPRGSCTGGIGSSLGSVLICRGQNTGSVSGSTLTSSDRSGRAELEEPNPVAEVTRDGVVTDCEIGSTILLMSRRSTLPVL